MRTNLKIFRIQQHLSQAEFSEKIGCSRATYSAIESGIRCGRQTFWKDVQKAFGLADEDMWKLMLNEE